MIGPNYSKISWVDVVATVAVQNTVLQSFTMELNLLVKFVYTYIREVCIYLYICCIHRLHFTRLNFLQPYEYQHASILYKKALFLLIKMVAFNQLQPRY